VRRLLGTRSQHDGTPRGTSGDVCESRNLPISTTLIQESAARATSAVAHRRTCALGAAGARNARKTPEFVGKSQPAPPTRVSLLSSRYLPFAQSQLEIGQSPPTKPEPALDIPRLRLASTGPASRVPVVGATVGRPDAAKVAALGTAGQTGGVRHRRQMVESAGGAGVLRAFSQGRKHPWDTREVLPQAR